jgi:integrase
MKTHIRTRKTKRHGVAFDLYYSWQGTRYRPLLGFNLTEEEAEIRAHDMISKIHRGEAPRSGCTTGQNPQGLTFKEFVPEYWKAFRVKARLDAGRPEAILRNHLLPRFGDRLLSSLTASDGLSYLEARLEMHAAPGTIDREWSVLMRILNLAVSHDQLEKNRLRCVELPDVSHRERVATDEELQAIWKEAPEELRRILIVALMTGLRESKILSIGRSWLKKRDDGFWLMLPPAASRIKGTPRELPLSHLALAALKDEIPNIGRDPLFTRWNRQALGVFWSRLCTRVKVQDLHFHDLRHTFATRLQNLGVGLEVRAQLLGHRLRGLQGQTTMTSAYSHGGPGWNAELRRAVTLLETSYGFLWNPISAGATSPKSLKNWCPQRDLNPCCSLERAAS